jgi:hypothetical protein
MEKNDLNGGYAICTTCTIRLVKTCYHRAGWFRIVREPLRYGMVIMGRIYGVKHNDYRVKSEECKGCVRFIKTGLKEKSSIFRFLNGIINPVFDRIIETIVSEQEVLEAKKHAREATHV